MLLSQFRSVHPGLVTALAVLMVVTTLPRGSARAAEIANAGPSGTTKPSLRIGVVAVPARKSDTEAALVVGTLLRGEARKLGGATLLLPIQGSDPTSLDPARDLVDQGMRLLRAKHFKDATELYQQAEVITDGYTGLPDRRLLARVYKGLAIVAWAGGDHDAGRQAARRSLLLWPDQSDAEWAHNKDISRLYRDVRVQWDTTPTGSLDIKSSPGRAEVFLDGVSRGFAPIVLDGLRVGQHHLFLAGDGFAGDQRWVDVGSEKVVPVQVRLAPIANRSGFKEALRRFVRVASRPQRARPLMDVVARAHGDLDRLLVVAVHRTSGGFELTGVASGIGSSTGASNTGTMQAVHEQVAQDDFLLGNLGGIARNVFGLEVATGVGKTAESTRALEPAVARGVVVPMIDGGVAGENIYIHGGAQVFHEGKKKKHQSIAKKWWFWVAIGAVVGGAVVGIVAASGSSSGSQGPTGQLSLGFTTPGGP